MLGYRPKSPAEERAELEALVKSAKERLDEAEKKFELAKEDDAECLKLYREAVDRYNLALKEREKAQRDLEDLEAEWRGYK